MRPEHIEVLGALDQIATRSSNYLVTPFVGVVIAETPYPFALANREVAELLGIPVEHLRSDDFFGAESNPELRFESTAILPLDEETFDIEGNLTLNGVTNPVTLKG